MRVCRDLGRVCGAPELRLDTNKLLLWQHNACSTLARTVAQCVCHVLKVCAQRLQTSVQRSTVLQRLCSQRRCSHRSAPVTIRYQAAFVYKSAFMSKSAFKTRFIQHNECSEPMVPRAGSVQSCTPVTVTPRRYGTYATLRSDFARITQYPLIRISIYHRYTPGSMAVSETAIQF